MYNLLFSTIYVAVGLYRIVSNEHINWIKSGFFVIGILWSALAELDQVVSAQGKVISSGRLQVIEHFEGGRVQKIHVKTGEEVNSGDLLISLVPIQAQGEFNIVKENNFALAIRLARLNAELSQTNKLFNKS